MLCLVIGITIAVVLGAPPRASSARNPAPAEGAATHLLEVRAAGQVTGPADPAEVESFFDTQVQRDLDELRIAGATVSVVRDGRIIFARGYGQADVEADQPVVADRTLFRVGSVSKLIVATAVMQMVEQGKLDLHTDVNSYLTDFKVHTKYEAASSPRMNLTSGRSESSWNATFPSRSVLREP
jgi:CubicO group peptidase (beta-lactamase class C family)